MAMTLEQIQGMNLQVGDAIEIEGKFNSCEGNHKIIGYFISLEDDGKEKYVSVGNGKIENKILNENDGYYLSIINSLTILTPKK
jgi:hypothetical protein